MTKKLLRGKNKKEEWPITIRLFILFTIEYFRYEGDDLGEIQRIIDKYQ